LFPLVVFVVPLWLSAFLELRERAEDAAGGVGFVEDVEVEAGDVVGEEFGGLLDGKVDADFELAGWVVGVLF
jgi:hypothetical protein